MNWLIAPIDLSRMGRCYLRKGDAGGLILDFYTMAH